ncbi:MAG: tyrosine-type recombinase/integrase [Prochloraceae cyanobacterium]|nr:tyrosine-type recombinase/integrase [Prochloraceae cyanobacterium]
MVSTLTPYDPQARELANYLHCALAQRWLCQIADGDAADDTVKTYRYELKQYFQWCQYNRIDPLEATKEHILLYRRYLVKKGYKVKTIALKLTVVRRLYAAAVEKGLIANNPAIYVKPPTKRVAPAERNNYLELEEAQKLIDCLPVENTLVGLRDRLLVCLMVVAGCRQIGLYRLNVGDIIRRRGQVGLRVEAKGSVRVIPLTADVAVVLEKYLKARRAEGEKLTKDTPMFVSVSRNSDGQRLTRRSMQRIVNAYLEKAALKHCESRTVTTHGLRHTVGYLLTMAGKPLRVIQDFLGHCDPRTTAIYAHIVNLWSNNPATSLGLVLLS